MRNTLCALASIVAAFMSIIQRDSAATAAWIAVTLLWLDRPERRA